MWEYILVFWIGLDLGFYLGSKSAQKSLKNILECKNRQRDLDYKIAKSLNKA